MEMARNFYFPFLRPPPYLTAFCCRVIKCGAVVKAKMIATRREILKSDGEKNTIGKVQLR